MKQSTSRFFIHYWVLRVLLKAKLNKDGKKDHILYFHLITQIWSLQDHGTLRPLSALVFTLWLLDAQNFHLEASEISTGPKRIVGGFGISSSALSRANTVQLLLLFSSLSIGQKL